MTPVTLSRASNPCAIFFVLTRHAVGDEHDLVRMNGSFEALELLHHVVIDLQSTRGIDNDDTIPRALGLLDAVLRDLHDILRIALGVDRNVQLRAEGLQLVDGGGAIDVACDEARRAIFCFQAPRELRRRRRLSRSLKSDHHDDGWRNGAQLESFAPLAQHRGQLVIDNFDQLLAGRDRADLRNADRFLLDALEELAGELKVDVGLEEDAPDFAEAFLDVGLGKHAAAAQARKGRFEFL